MMADQNHPVFSDGAEPDGAEPDEDFSPTSQSVELVLDVDGDSPLTIKNFRTELPTRSSAKSRNAFVRAIGSTGMLDDDGAHAVARGLIHPDTAAQLARNGLLPEETVETATLSHLTAYVWATELWPLLQPRIGGESLAVDEPTVTGVVDDDGDPTAILQLTFRDHQHLVDFIHETVTHTRTTGGDYTSSILSRRVGRAMVVHVVRLSFLDGSASLTVLAVRDGVTRLISAMAGRLGGSPSPDQIAQVILDELLSTKKPRAGKEHDENQDRARGREEVLDEYLSRFRAGTVGGAPTEDAIRIGQTLPMPAQVYVGVHPLSSTSVPPTAVFGEAIRDVLAGIHTEFQSWSSTAQAADVGGRALLRVQHGGRLHPDIVGLATGSLHPNNTARVFGDAEIPDTGLWRAVYLVWALTQPEAYEAVRHQLKGLLGLTIIQRKRYAAFLGPIVDRPWRKSKSRSLQQARRAWAGGGPVPHELMGTEWTPIPTMDFLSLVVPAIEGNTDARHTLEVAGGIALVADGLLASNVGSAVQWGSVPFRADPHEVVKGMASREAGLYQLAYAAQTFQVGVAALNSFSPRELNQHGIVPSHTYLVPVVDPDDPGTVLVDGMGQESGLTRFEVVRLSDPARAAREIQKREEQKRSFDTTMPTGPAEMAVMRRVELESGLKSIEDILQELFRLAASEPSRVGPALGDHETWTRVSAKASRVSSLIVVNEPREELSEPEHDEDPDGDLDEETDE